MDHSDTDSSDANADSFFSNALAPGSSLHPTFLLIVDGAFFILLIVLLTLLFFTSGNLHLLALVLIELCLWGSVKWFVNELKIVSLEKGSEAKVTGEGEDSEPKKYR